MDPDRRGGLTAPTLGLSSTDAAAILRRDGPNTLPAPRRPPAVWRFARQLIHFFALMLWVAAGLALIADLPQLSIAVAAVILLNGTFAFVQEHRADRAAERLGALMPTQVTVRRDGRRTVIDAGQVVTGDVLALESGDRVPADSVAQPDTTLQMDTSLLTGESEPTTVEGGGRLYAGRRTGRPQPPSRATHLSRRRTCRRQREVSGPRDPGAPEAATHQQAGGGAHRAEQHSGQFAVP
jgi:hypothetical protein